MGSPERSWHLAPHVDNVSRTWISFPRPSLLLNFIKDGSYFLSGAAHQHWSILATEEQMSQEQELTGRKPTTQPKRLLNTVDIVFLVLLVHPVYISTSTKIIVGGPWLRERSQIGRTCHMQFRPNFSADRATSPVVNVASIHSIWIHCKVSKPGESHFNHCLNLWAHLIHSNSPFCYINVFTVENGQKRNSLHSNQPIDSYHWNSA